MKWPIYTSPGIPECWVVNLPEDWVVNLPEDRIEVYSDPESDRYKDQTIFNPGDKVFDVSEILINRYK
ncbi:Uma2 family endonuclease [Membranicola marinus]|uniref:Uma2 family endonuclease n=1 Tax=Membranihabitans marinus TaxID=1227546 RepID=A0A953HJB5_9BACT|nr:Uma2 family endonuclease [Membranihabitans marinus]